MVHIPSLLSSATQTMRSPACRGHPSSSRLLPARLLTACAALAQPSLEICGLPVGFSFPLLSPEEKKQGRVNLLVSKLRETWHHVQSQRMWAGAISLPHAALGMELSPALQLPGCSCPGSHTALAAAGYFGSSPQRQATPLLLWLFPQAHQSSGHVV